MSRRKVFSLFGSLVVEGMGKASGELKQFDKDVKTATRQLQAMGRDAVKTGAALSKAITAPVLALTGAMVLLNNKTGQYADKLLDLKQITALSTDTLQGMEVVSRHAGVNFEGLTSIVQRLTSRMPMIITEGGAAADAFHALGFSTKEVVAGSKNMDTFLPHIINKLQGISNETDRNIIAQQIFGKSLTDIAPVLGMSADEFNRLLGSAQDYSGYMSEEALQSANDYRIAAENLKAEFFGIWRELSMRVIPIFRDTLIPILTETFLPAIRSAVDFVGDLAGRFNRLDKGTKELVISIIAFATALGPMLMIVGKMLPLLKGLVPLYIALTKGQLSLNLAMKANPVGLVVTAIGVLITAGIYLARNFDYVKEKAHEFWMGLAYYTQQGVIFVQEKILHANQLLYELVNRVGKHIPFLNKSLDTVIAKIQGQRDALKNTSSELKIWRQESQLAKQSTDELAVVVEKAKQNTTEYNMEMFENAAAKDASAEKTEKLIDTEAELARKRSELEEDWGKRVFYQAADRLTQLRYEEQEALRIAGDVGAKREDIELYYSIERLKIADAEEKQRVENARRAENEIRAERRKTMDASIDAIRSVLQIFSGATEVKIQRLDAQLQKNIEIINHSKMAEEEKITAIQTLETEADKKRVELKRKEAKQNKLMAIFDIGIKTAQAIMQAFANFAYPLNVVFAAISGAIGVAQTAIVAAKPIPFKSGGLVKGNRGGVVGEIGESTDDELILPMRKGVEQFVSSFIRQLSSLSMPMHGMALAGGGGSSYERHEHYHIGTVIANEDGFRELDRRMRKYRISEDARTGT